MLPGIRLNCTNYSEDISNDDYRLRIEPYPIPRVRNISETEHFLIFSDQYPTKESAEEACARIVEYLIFSMTKERIGIRILDTRTICSNAPIYAPHCEGYVYASKSISLIKETLLDSFTTKHLSIRDYKLAFSIFQSSFIQQDIYSKLVLLITSIESIIVKNSDYLASISKNNKKSDSLKCKVDSCLELEPNEKIYIKQLIGEKKHITISNLGKPICKHLLGDKLYFDLTAQDFFIKCYDIRSRIVHAKSNFPTQDELGLVVVFLEEFVRDLLFSPNTSSLLEALKNTYALNTPEYT